MVGVAGVVEAVGVVGVGVVMPDWERVGWEWELSRWVGSGLVVGGAGGWGGVRVGRVGWVRAGRVGWVRVGRAGWVGGVGVVVCELYHGKNQRGLSG